MDQTPAICQTNKLNLPTIFALNPWSFNVNEIITLEHSEMLINQFNKINEHFKYFCVICGDSIVKGRNEAVYFVNKSSFANKLSISTIEYCSNMVDPLHLFVCFWAASSSWWLFVMYSPCMFASCSILAKDVSIMDNRSRVSKVDFIFRSFVPCRAHFQCVLAPYLRLAFLKFCVPFFTADNQHTSLGWPHGLFFFMWNEYVCTKWFCEC